MTNWVAPQIIKFKSVIPTLLKILAEMPKVVVGKGTTTTKEEDEEDGVEIVGTKPTYSIQMMMNAVLLLRYLVSESKQL